MVSQLTQTSWDGSSPNSQMDCVPACLCAGVMYLKGVSAVNAEYNPDLFLDKVYGESHRGGTDAKDYVSFLASLGVHLYEVGAASASFQVEEVHSLLAKGSPAVITIIDPYVPASYGWTHAVIAFAEKPGEITVLDPYIGKPVTKSDSEWTALSRGNLLWVMEVLLVQLDISMPAVAAMFEQLDATHWKDRATGRILQDAHLADYKANGVVSLERLGHMISPERYLGDDVIVNFEFGVRAWSKTTGKVRSLALYDGGTGTDPAVAKLQAQLTAAQAQPAAPQEHAALLQMTEAGATALGKHLV